jgi:hypothetical protein
VASDDSRSIVYNGKEGQIAGRFTSDGDLILELSEEEGRDSFENDLAIAASENVTLRAVGYMVCGAADAREIKAKPAQPSSPN